MRRLFIIIVAVVFVVGTGALFAPAGEPEEEFVRIATGGTGGNFYRLGAGIASVWNDEVEGIVASTQSTDGSPHNAELLAAGEVEVAFMGADIARDAYHNTGDFADEPEGYYEDLKFITYLYPNPQMFLVMDWAADEIESLRDLEGKRVSKGAIGSLGEAYFLETMDVVGIDPGDVSQEDTVHGAAIDQVRDGHVDVVLWPDAAGSASHMEILETGDAEAYSLDDDVIEHFTTGDWDINFEYTMPADTYPNQPEDIETFAAPIILLAHGDLDDELVYELTKQIHENQEDLVAIADLLAEFMTLDAALEGQDIPLHSGAEQFYQDAGVLGSN